MASRQPVRPMWGRAAFWVGMLIALLGVIALILLHRSPDDVQVVTPTATATIAVVVLPPSVAPITPTRTSTPTQEPVEAILTPAPSFTPTASATAAVAIPETPTPARTAVQKG